MTRQEIATMIGGIGLPYAYDHFDDRDGAHPQGPPFICFMYPNDDDLQADNINYAHITALVIELYTDNVDFDLEGAVEAALTANALPYAKAETYIDGERMYQTTYTTEVSING
ncbi:MAG: hypothetical protein IKD53_00910 [Clostridia bacterium]|nr:hypothetical protein [Clostridia bacterium]